MEIRSRFLNADVEVEKVHRDGDRLFFEGTVKGLMPVRIGIDAADAVRIVLRSLNAESLLFWAGVPRAILRELLADTAVRFKAARACQGAP